ncbi:hypothetical protein KY358_03990 [Candidatus Woesearchaeota archaeon]|nr:hypothetical protein [Candidatus Woesearchaeota archaeon]
MEPDYIDQVVQYFGRLLKEDETAPGNGGKKRFFQKALESKVFLPDNLKKKIDEDRGNTPQKDYLLSLPTFNGEFSIYI